MAGIYHPGQPTPHDIPDGETEPDEDAVKCECDLDYRCDAPQCDAEYESYRQQYATGQLTAEGLSDSWLTIDPTTGRPRTK